MHWLSLFIAFSFMFPSVSVSFFLFVVVNLLVQSQLLYAFLLLQTVKTAWLKFPCPYKMIHACVCGISNIWYPKILCFFSILLCHTWRVCSALHFKITCLLSLQFYSKFTYYSGESFSKSFRCLKQDNVGEEAEKLQPQNGDMKGNELKIEVPVWRIVVPED